MKIILDCNIFDNLAKDIKLCQKINELIIKNKLAILITPTIRKELIDSPFQGIPSFFPTEYIGESIFLTGGSVGDRCGAGAVFYEHMGKSKKYKDALIADAASCDANFLVTEDIRLKKRAKIISNKCKSIDYNEFNRLIYGMFT